MLRQTSLRLPCNCRLPSAASQVDCLKAARAPPSPMSSGNADVLSLKMACALIAAVASWRFCSMGPHTVGGCNSLAGGSAVSWRMRACQHVQPEAWPWPSFAAAGLAAVPAQVRLAIAAGQVC